MQPLTHVRLLGHVTALAATALAAALPLPAMASTPASPELKVPALTAEQRAACAALPLDFGRETAKLRLLRASRAADGSTRVDEEFIEGQLGAFYEGKVRLTQFGLGQPSKVVLVYGYPGIEIPPHAAPYREMFIILTGMSEMVLADGRRLELTPGTIFLSEDIGGPPRGGRAGPCGYVAIDLQFKPVQP
jgi:hypothetical protein